eukprot:gene10115-2281_t
MARKGSNTNTLTTAKMHQLSKPACQLFSTADCCSWTELEYMQQHILTSMFEKSLSDLIRGIRSHTEDEVKFISSCMDEIRKELAQPDLDIKATALAKLSYLQMLGYDMSWAAFHVVEVMTSKKYSHRRIGFLAASQSFHQDTDVLMLTTNMLKKSLTSHNQYESGLALNGLANFIREDLARDLASDLISLLTSVRPYVRKRATLVMYKLFLRYPDALRAAYQRLKDKLEDEDPSVQAAAVNVICELARKNPKNYLSLAPTFFKLLTTSQNNWMRIKIVKLFAALCPLEPRLGRKLIEPLTELIHGTPATSLLYECISTVLASVPDHTATIQLCVQKLRIFIEDSDQNLKYLGLRAMSQVLKISPKSVQPHRDLIIACLDDDDESIRLRALDLLAGMVNKKTLIDIVRKLLQHLEVIDGQSYRDEVVGKIIFMCSQSNYQYITNFEWYVQVLVQLTRVESTKHGRLIADQLMDVSIRVKSLRPFSAKQMAALLMDSRLYSAHNVECGVSEVLYAAGWIAGEFSELLDDIEPVLSSYLQSRSVNLPEHVQAIFIHNAIKLLLERIPLFIQSPHLEVQERAVYSLQVIQFIESDLAKGHSPHVELALMYSGDLNPVAPRAQKKVPLPENIDLDKWINSPPESDDEEAASSGDLFSQSLFGGMSDKSSLQASRIESEDEDDLHERRQQRLAAQASNPYHLGGYSGLSVSKVSQPQMSSLQFSQDDIDSIPVKTLDLGPSIRLDVAPPGSLLVDLDVTNKKGKKKKKKRLSKKAKAKLLKKGLPIPEEEDDDDDDDGDGDGIGAKFDVLSVEDVPEGAEISDNDETLHADDLHAALDIDLDTIESGFELPKPEHYSATRKNTAGTVKEKNSSKKKKSKKKSKKKHSHKEHTSKDLLNETDETQETNVSTLEADNIEKTPTVSMEVTSSTLDSWLDGKDDSKKKNIEKKAKKKKKEKSDKKSKKGKHEVTGENLNTDAVCTPDIDSKQSDDTSITLQQEVLESPQRRLRPLVKDSTVAVAYSLSVSEHQLILQLVFKNHSNHEIRYLSFATNPESENMEPIVIESALNADETTTLTIPIVIETDKKSARIPGRIEYKFQESPVADHNEVDTQDKLAVQPSHGEDDRENPDDSFSADPDKDIASTHHVDFILEVSVCDMMAVVNHQTQNDFRSLLEEGALSSPSSVTLHKQGVPFEAAVQTICGIVHGQLVEAVQSAASIYSTTVSGGHVCLLVKDSGDDVTVDAKCSDPLLSDAIVEELSSQLS